VSTDPSVVVHDDQLRAVRGSTGLPVDFCEELSALALGKDCLPEDSRLLLLSSAPLT
jgi:hypothetical protein